MGIINLPGFSGYSKKDPETKRPAPQSISVTRMALGAGTVLILSFLLSIHLIPSKVSLHIGDISTEEVRAHRNVRKYVDSAETERLRREASARVEKQYRDLPNAASDAADSVANVFAVLAHAREDKNLRTMDQKVNFVRTNVRLEVNDETLKSFLAFDSRTYGQIETYTEELVKDIAGREIRDDNDDVEKAHTEFRRRMTNYLGSPQYSSIASALGDRYITSNRIYDADATERVTRQRAQAVPIKYGQIWVDDIVVKKGERITREHMDKLTALGLSNPEIDYVSVLCICLLVSCVVGFAVLYLSRYHPRVYGSNKLLLLLALITVLNVLGLKLGASMLGINLNESQIGYFAISWIATAGMLTAILLEPKVAVLLIALLATTWGVAMNHESRWTFSALVTGLVGIYSVSDIRHRSDLWRAIGVLCGANLVLVWVVGRVSGDDVGSMLVGSAWALGGFVSVMLCALGTTALERPFGITTHNRLIELSDTNNPILKRLLMEAPGTYSHSIFTGNIASMAADTIGADALLVRVASYYHDIGKIKRAHFFVENQHVENVHDRLNPSLSALVIRSHIKDGLELAREYKLPPLLCELMSQHHGTSLVRYFFSQAALNASGSTTALEQQFRYEGTKPQTREAALLMLADAVEAASRTLSQPTPGQIEDLVEGIIHEKLTDGQLDQSDLTFKDVSRIRESFIRTLMSMMHARIEYPDLPGVEGKKSFGNGSNGKESAAGQGGSEKADRNRQEISAG